MTAVLSREIEIDPRHVALLIIDVQNYTARRDGGEYRELSDSEIELFAVSNGSSETRKDFLRQPVAQLTNAEGVDAEVL